MMAKSKVKPPVKPAKTNMRKPSVPASNRGGKGKTKITSFKDIASSNTCDKYDRSY